MRDFDDRWVRAAVLSSVGRRADELLGTFISRATGNNAGRSALLGELCRLCGITDSTKQLISIVDEIAAANGDRDAGWQEAALGGLDEGLRARTTTEGGRIHLENVIAGDSPITRLTRERVEYLQQHCGETITNLMQPLDARLVALRFLAATEATNVTKVLPGLVEPQQPVEIQVAAIRALGELPDADINALLTGDRWSSYTPPVREAVLACVLNHKELVKGLLNGIAAGNIPLWSIDQNSRAELTNAVDANIRQQAIALFQNAPANDRMKVYEDYKSILKLTPNPQNGHAVFSKTCAGCHAFAGEGYQVGPDLTGIRNQASETLLLHIVVPEYEILPSYTCYTITTKDGNALTGLLATETPTSIMVRQALGHEETISRANLARMVASRFSLMPDGLEQTMTRQDLADLIGFLKGM
jgi:putative heme-binding domain-containing protein